MIDLELIASPKHKLRCQIDTGCDDPLILYDVQRGLTLGIRFNLSPYGRRAKRYLADGSAAYFFSARTTIDWFGSPRPITVLAPVPSDDPIDPNRALLSHDGLIGLGLLFGHCTLGLNFLSRPGQVLLHPPLGS